MKLTQQERFDAMTMRDGDCLLWTGGLTATGAGNFFVNAERGVLLAHRFSYEQKYGRIPKARYIKQTCGNLRCVEINHLKLVRRAEVNAPSSVRGEANPRTHLTDDDVRAIRADQRPMRTIAADYEISANGVWNIKHRKTWSHVQ